MRRAIERTLAEDRGPGDALDRLFRLGAPTADIDLAAQVYDLFVQLCPVILAVTLADTDRAKSMLGSVPNMSVRDAIHAAVMTNNDVDAIATFDTGFDSMPGISRMPLG